MTARFKDIFALQDEIVRKIVTHAEAEARRCEEQAVHRAANAPTTWRPMILSCVGWECY